MSRLPLTTRQAALYAALHRGTEGDMAFYLSACAEASAILELGCGAGRIARALAVAGHRVVGVDIEPELLAIAEADKTTLAPEVRARLEYRQGDIRNFESDERFDRILLTHSTLYALPDDSALGAVLARARHHSAAGGVMLADAYAADPFHRSLDPSAEDEFEEVARVEALDRTWQVFERSDWDRDAQRLHAHYRYVSHEGEVATIDIEHRYLCEDQIRELWTAHGFAPPLIAGDFRGGAYDPDESEIMIVIAEVESTE